MKYIIITIALLFSVVAIAQETNENPDTSYKKRVLETPEVEFLSSYYTQEGDNALKLAEHLEKNPEVEKVYYPFLPSHPQYELAKKQMKAGGGVISFLLKDGIEQGKRFLNSNDWLTHGVNLGDTRTIITNPASTTHSKLTNSERSLVGIESSSIRISVGLENIEDIINDINQALEKSK